MPIGRPTGTGAFKPIADKMIESIWIAVAFAFGLLMRPIGLPPLVGYLLAGFLLQAAGWGDGAALQPIAHLGVLLLLFSVGLKLRLKGFLTFHNIGGGTLHILATAALSVIVVSVMQKADLRANLIVALLLTFSSTVVAAKALEERRELRAFHGRVAVGILVLQDLVAVALMAGAADASPSWWALLVLALPLLRPAMLWLLDVSGHDELLILCGLLLAVAIGGYGFEALGLSPELGALLIGALLANHRKSKELSDSLWSLKEMFLVGFFLQIGMSGLPNLRDFIDALILLSLLPLKAALLFFIMLKVGLRARSSFLVSLSLASYSEFALIAANLVIDHGWLEPHWVMPLALAVALSFAIMAPLNRHAHDLFERFEGPLSRFETVRSHPDDEPISVGQAHVLIMGMGRIGSGAYDFLRAREQRVVGLDSDPAKVEKHLQAQRRVLYADAEDPAFWSRLRMDGIDAVMLTLPDAQANLIATRQLRRRGFKGLISAASRHPEEADNLRAAGANLTFNVYDEAGVGFAEHVWEELYPANRHEST